MIRLERTGLRVARTRIDLDAAGRRRSPPAPSPRAFVEVELIDAGGDVDATLSDVWFSSSKSTFTVAASVRHRRRGDEHAPVGDVHRRRF